jgi:hypothetical protein
MRNEMAQQSFHIFFKFIWLLAFSSALQGQEETNQVRSYDVVIYGGTSAGVVAAVQASKMGKTVVLIEPGEHIGGMTSNGLGWVDINNPDAIGGIALQFFNKVWQFYQRDSSWRWEPKYPIKGPLVDFHPEDHQMWVLEPHVGEKIFKAMLVQSKIPLILGEKLNRKSGVQMNGARLIQITMESNLVITGKMFIDATYAGDLMAAAQVSYCIGREPNSFYQETFNGIYPNNSTTLEIDPYVIKGNPESGLLPRIFLETGEKPGDADNRVQAYNYRMCLTDVPENRIEVEKPKGYDEQEYEIVFRAIEAGVAVDEFFKLDLLPNRKTDSNNKGKISTDFVGMSWNYAEADYELRKEIAQEHEKWQRGLIWTLQNHPRIPLIVKAHYASWGLPKDEFINNNHWPYELYVREARRMISSIVINEQNVLVESAFPDSIGLASYNIDSHAVKYVVNSTGMLGTEGGLFQKVMEPYSISYRAIVPLREECENLLVPVCLSASHVAYGSIRVEPTFMVLGQSAATAACLALDLDVTLQDLPYDPLRKQLLSDGQILDWNK